MERGWIYKEEGKRMLRQRTGAQFATITDLIKKMPTKLEGKSLKIHTDSIEAAITKLNTPPSTTNGVRPLSQKTLDRIRAQEKRNEII
jgi:hypothetical protein